MCVGDGLVRVRQRTSVRCPLENFASRLRTHEHCEGCAIVRRSRTVSWRTTDFLYKCRVARLIRLRHEIDWARVAPETLWHHAETRSSRKKRPTPLLRNPCQHAARGVRSDGCELSGVKLSATRRSPNAAGLDLRKGFGHGQGENPQNAASSGPQSANRDHPTSPGGARGL